MNDAPLHPTIEFRLESNETAIRELTERQIRADERQSRTEEKMEHVYGTVDGLYDEVRSLRHELTEDRKGSMSWLRAIALLVPAAPILMHLLGLK